MNLLRVESVAKKLDCHRTTVLRLARTDPEFPKPIKFSSRFIAWPESLIDEWLLTRKQEGV